MIDIPTKQLENGFAMPVYGLGLWQMGGRKKRDATNDAADIEAIRNAILQGVNHIDTAEVYGDGHAEELLREAIQGIPREGLLISTKVAAPNQGYDGTKHALYKSLERMGLSYVDLYMIHRFPEPGISIKDTMRAMDALYEEGLIKNIGVSNLSPKRFDVAQSYTKNKIVYNQVHYNVQYREAEQYGLLEHAKKNDYFLAAWRPVQKGLLPESELLAEVAKKYNKTPTQIAINWLISQDNVVTLSKTASPQHLAENLGALDFTMEHNDIEKIRHEFPNQQTVSDAVPLDYLADVGAK